MKKIFAIALALVMVLSMASAFAMTCTTGYDWSCATTTYNCGKGSVEVIPYVKGNGCGTGVTYTPSTCAGAVNGDQVYFAVKVTVDANPSEEWWGKAAMTVDVKGLVNVKPLDTATAFGTGPEGYVMGLVKAANDNEFKAGEYYLVNDGAWKVIKAADFDADAAGSLFTARVNNAAKAKICVALKSALDVSMGGVDVDVADWKVTYRKADKNLVFDVFDGTTWKYSAAIVHFNSDDKVEWVASDFEGSATDNKFVAWDGDQLVKADGTRVGTSCGAAAKVAAVLKYFNINFGTCITEKAIKANFGWDDKVESCFSWSKDVVSVVNTDCVVAIPKTGDVSVVAYAVMAVVAAAGTMLKK